MTQDQQQMLGGVMMLLVVVLIIGNRYRVRGRGSRNLDQVLFAWNKHDKFTVRGLLDGGVSILGRTGSGKTSAAGRHLGEAIVGNRNSSGLICGAKPEDLAMWQGIFKRAGRSKDLLVMEPGGDLRINFLEEASRYGGQTREITQFITTVGETLRRGHNQRRMEGADFWEAQAERRIYSAVEVLRLVKGTVTAPDLQQFIMTAPLKATQLREEGWRLSFHGKCIEAAYAKAKSTTEEHDFQIACDYELDELPNMADKMRSSIITTVLGILHVFNSGVVRETVSTRTDVHLRDIVEGRKFLFINAPPSSHGATGTFLNVGAKHLMELVMLQREVNANSPFHVIWCDEAPQLVTSFDSHSYVPQCRSHRGCMVLLGQSLPSYYTAFGGENGKQQAHEMLANFGHHIIHALGDIESAEWASALVGKQLETFFGGSMQPAQDSFDQLFGNQQFTGSFSTQYQPRLQASAFMQGLRTGGPQNLYLADAFVIKTGEPFSNGNNCLQVTFSQR
ncbi:MAG: type IV secretory system conjugative DNA transfer family protein [Pirellulales bacterium]|nr:type IV secretory system conjugative DNA transfer family protein [Pirellulales bacterium]